MSSSTHSTDEAIDEGQGYADGAVESSSLVGSSILGSIGEEKALEVASEEGEVEMKVDAAREWTDATPPPTVIGYDLAPHEVGLYAPYFITSDSLEYLVSALKWAFRFPFQTFKWACFENWM